MDKYSRLLSRLKTVRAQNQALINQMQIQLEVIDELIASVPSLIPAYSNRDLTYPDNSWSSESMDVDNYSSDTPSSQISTSSSFSDGYSSNSSISDIYQPYTPPSITRGSINLPPYVPQPDIYPYIHTRFGYYDSRFDPDPQFYYLRVYRQYPASLSYSNPPYNRFFKLLKPQKYSPPLPSLMEMEIPVPPQLAIEFQTSTSSSLSANVPTPPLPSTPPPVAEDLLIDLSSPKKSPLPAVLNFTPPTSSWSDDVDDTFPLTTLTTMQPTDPFHGCDIFCGLSDDESWPYFTNDDWLPHNITDPISDSDGTTSSPSMPPPGPPSKE